MALIQKKTPEQLAAKVAEKEQKDRDAAARAAEREQDRQRQLQEKLRNDFLASPVGRARTAYERGDHVFQYSIDVMSQQAIIVAMVGSATSKKASDPTDVLNAVCAQGWELVNGSFVFVEEGQQSRDKFMSSGQNVAIKGTTFGYYLFRRCESNRREAVQAWEGATEVLVT
jgi:hypothetical protein